MSSSTRSGCVVGGRGEADADAGGEAVVGAGAVAFEGEQVVAGLEDRFDALPDRREVEALGRLVLSVWPDDGGVEQAGGGLELAAGVALVADHEQMTVPLAAFEQSEADLALGRL